MNRNKYPKGSKGMIQCLVKEHKSLLDEKLGVNLSWISPIEENQFKEYQLNGDFISTKIGLPSNAFDNFWPSKQPQWDGLAMDDEHTLYLIEAKSHLSEIKSGNYKPNNTNEKKDANYNLKKNALINIKRHYAPDADDKLWLHHYYQITNRLAFLRRMKELSSVAKYKDAKLIFLNFENDSSWETENKSVPKDGWKNKYKKILQELRISKGQLQNEGVLIIDIDGSNF